MIRCALGVSRSEHEEGDDDGIQKSISNSTTFRPIYKYEDFLEKLVEISEELSERMEKHQIMGRTITVEFKSTKFDLKNKSMGLNNYISSIEEI